MDIAILLMSLMAMVVGNLPQRDPNFDFRIPGLDSWFRIPGLGLLGLDSWLWIPGFLGLVSWVWIPGFGFLGLESWIWIPGLGFLGLES